MSVFSTSRLENKTVLITGASGGIGQATAVLFAKAGANLILVARRAAELESVKTECEAANKAAGSGAGGKVVTVVCDVAKKSEILKIFDTVPEELKKVDILLNNAGLAAGVSKIGSISDDDLEAMMTVNVYGLIHLTQLVVNQFKAQNSGHVINVGSIAGREPYAGGAIYCATKHAVRSFTTSLMKELVDTPIRVSEVQPGLVETGFSVRRLGDKASADKVYNGMTPLVAEDIAEEIVWVANRPPHVNIAELFVLPTCQAGATIVHRSA